MTKEEKQLLLIDLCARLPHHVRCKVWLKDDTTEEGFLDLEHNYGNVLQDAFYYNKIKDVKPYLRPMSSMTKEEEETECYLRTYQARRYADFCNSKHLDYRGLIEKGLALEAPEDMYKF